MKRWFHVLLTLLLATVITTTVATAVHERPAQAFTPFAYHNCPGLPGIVSGPHVWTDLHHEYSPLVVNMRRMVCSAADYSTIDIKMWYVAVTDYTVERLVRDLLRMQVYHHVRVNVFVGRNAYRYNSGARNWLSFLHAFWFANIYACHAECISTVPGGVTHSKWITISQLRYHGPATLTTSTNISSQQFHQAQSGIFVANNLSFYDALVRRWNVYLSCAGGGPCDHVLAPTTWHGYGSMYVYFAPTSSDPIAEMLSRIGCQHGGMIQLASLYLYRNLVRQQLVRMRHAGCYVQVLLEHAPTSQTVIDELHPRCYYDHDKFLVVNTPVYHLVVAGSEDMSYKALTVNDNEMVRTSKPGPVASYHHFMHLMFWRSNYCHLG